VIVEIRPLSKMSNEQGILWIDNVVADINGCKDLLDSRFGTDVKEKLLSMRAHLKDGGVFTEKMEVALRNWNTGVLKWTKKVVGRTVQ